MTTYVQQNFPQNAGKFMCDRQVANDVTSISVAPWQIWDQINSPEFYDISNEDAINDHNWLALFMRELTDLENAGHGWRDFVIATDFLQDNTVIASDYILFETAYREHDAIIFEGAQGAMLSDRFVHRNNRINDGDYTTSGNCTLTDVKDILHTHHDILAPDYEEPMKLNVHYVTRTYATRH